MNHHNYNHDPQVRIFPVVSPDQPAYEIPVRRYTAPGFDAPKTEVVNMNASHVERSDNSHEPQAKPERSWEIADRLRAESAARQAEQVAQKRQNKERRQALARKAFGAFSFKKER